MSHVFHVFIAVLIVVTLLPHSADCEYIWIEGENQTNAEVEFGVAGWGNQHYLSGEKWIYGTINPAEIADKIPQDGAVLAYEFVVQSGGEFEVWGHIGYEFARSLFAWRIDDAKWQTVTPDDLTTDLLVLAE